MKSQIALAYVSAINAGDTGELYYLEDDDYLFIDAHDDRVEGKDDMNESWKGYFAMFPDYKIEVNEILEKDELVCLLGYASGTYKNLNNKENSNYWKIPAAWTAIVKNGKIKQWQVYADNIKVMDIIRRVDNE